MWQNSSRTSSSSWIYIQFYHFSELANSSFTLPFSRNFIESVLLIPGELPFWCSHLVVTKTFWGENMSRWKTFPSDGGSSQVHSSFSSFSLLDIALLPRLNLVGGLQAWSLGICFFLAKMKPLFSQLRPIKTFKSLPFLEPNPNPPSSGVKEQKEFANSSAF